MNGENRLGLMRRPIHCLPQGQLPPDVRSPASPTTFSLLKHMPSPSLPHKFLGSTKGGRGWQGLTAWSSDKVESCMTDGGLAEADVGTCGRDRPHCQWCRTPGASGDL